MYVVTLRHCYTVWHRYAESRRIDSADQLGTKQAACLGGMIAEVNAEFASCYVIVVDIVHMRKAER